MKKKKKKRGWATLSVASFPECPPPCQNGLCVRELQTIPPRGVSWYVGMLVALRAALPARQDGLVNSRLQSSELPALASRQPPSEGGNLAGLTRKLGQLTRKARSSLRGAVVARVPAALPERLVRQRTSFLYYSQA